MTPSDISLISSQLLSEKLSKTPYTVIPMLFALFIAGDSKPALLKELDIDVLPYAH